jgi:aminoglycoside 3-N-acetyltransferase
MNKVLAFRDILVGLRALELDRVSPVIVHISLSAFGQVQGGAQTMLGVLLVSFDSLVMPVFTYQTMITPEVGPPNNGITYGTGRDTNKLAVVFHTDLPADRVMGVVPETLRCHPSAKRSLHPILSFAGINAGNALAAQTYAEPLAPIRILTEMDGWVLLMGVDHTRNTSIHYGERLAGRNQFIRWALTPHGIRTCPGWPGCSDGFQAIAPKLSAVTREVEIGPGLVQAVPLPELVETARAWIIRDPMALLCNREDCARCNQVRYDALNAK